MTEHVWTPPVTVCACCHGPMPPTRSSGSTAQAWVERCLLCRMHCTRKPSGDYVHLPCGKVFTVK